VVGIDNPIHILFLGVVALVVLGPKRLPELAKALGNGIREFRESVNVGAENLMHPAPPANDAFGQPAVAAQAPVAPNPATQAATAPGPPAEAAQSQPEAASAVAQTAPVKPAEAQAVEDQTAATSPPAGQ
jgi:TatA/E family protein of Tat protein translocase